MDEERVSKKGLLNGKGKEKKRQRLKKRKRNKITKTEIRRKCCKFNSKTKNDKVQLKESKLRKQRCEEKMSKRQKKKIERIQGNLAMNKMVGA